MNSLQKQIFLKLSVFGVLGLAFFLFPAVPTCSAATTYTYDASLGTTPEAQGWTLFTADGAGITSVSGGVLSLNTTASDIVQHNWRVTADPFLYSDQVIVEATMRINSSGFLASPRRAGYYLAIVDNSTLPVWAGLANSSTHLIYDGENYSNLQGITLNDGNFHDFRMVLHATGFDLFIDNVQIINDPTRTGSSSFANFIGFGDFSGAAGSSTELSFFQVTAVPEPVTGALGIFAGILGATGLWRHMRRKRDICERAIATPSARRAAAR